MFQLTTVQILQSKQSMAINASGEMENYPTATQTGEMQRIPSVLVAQAWTLPVAEPCLNHRPVYNTQKNAVDTAGLKLKKVKTRTLHQ